MEHRQISIGAQKEVGRNTYLERVQKVVKIVGNHIFDKAAFENYILLPGYC